MVLVFRQSFENRSKDFALRLTLEERLRGTRKWPIEREGSITQRKRSAIGRKRGTGRSVCGTSRTKRNEVIMDEEKSAILGNQYGMGRNSLQYWRYCQQQNRFHLAINSGPRFHKPSRLSSACQWLSTLREISAMSNQVYETPNKKDKMTKTGLFG